MSERAGSEIAPFQTRYLSRDGTIVPRQEGARQNLAHEKAKWFLLRQKARLPVAERQTIV